MTHSTAHSIPGSISRQLRSRTTAALVVLVCLTGLAPVVTAQPAVASDVVEAQGVALDISATCARGNINITYAANGVERQVTSFTSEDGRVLDLFDSTAYDPNYQGTEYVLTKAGSNRGGNQAVPTPGTVLGVYVTLGSNPPTATNGEFFLLYRCDDQRNDQGGHNQVLSICVGDWGTCPTTAAEALADDIPDTTDTTAPPDDTNGHGSAAPVTAIPKYAG